MMAKVFKVKFKRKVHANPKYVIPEGLEIQVVSNSPKPSSTDVKNALEKQGLWSKTLATDISNAYVILD